MYSGTPRVRSASAALRSPCPLVLLRGTPMPRSTTGLVCPAGAWSPSGLVASSLRAFHRFIASRGFPRLPAASRRGQAPFRRPVLRASTYGAVTVKFTSRVTDLFAILSVTLISSR